MYILRGGTVPPHHPAPLKTARRGASTWVRRRSSFGQEQGCGYDGQDPHELWDSRPLRLDTDYNLIELRGIESSQRRRRNGVEPGFKTKK